MSSYNLPTTYIGSSEADDMIDLIINKQHEHASRKPIMIRPANRLADRTIGPRLGNNFPAISVRTTS